MLEANNIEALKIEELIALYSISGDESIKEKIICSHIDLVKKIAHTYNSENSAYYDDLVQVGCIGLIHAFERFDPSAGTSFRTYAANLIAGEMKHYLRDFIPLIKAPREFVELGSKIKQARQELGTKLNRDPENSEIAEYVGVSPEKFDDILIAEQALNFVSLDQDMDKKNDSDQVFSKIDQLEDKKYRSFQLVQEDRILVRAAMKKLKKQSREVIEFIFYYDLTQTETAKTLGISQMQVSRRLKNALDELWKILNKRVTPW